VRIRTLEALRASSRPAQSPEYPARLASRLSPRLPRGCRLCAAGDSAVGRDLDGVLARFPALWRLAGLASSRNAVRLCHGDRCRLSADGGPALDGAGGPVRQAVDGCRARLAGGAPGLAV